MYVIHAYFLKLSDLYRTYVFNTFGKYIECNWDWMYELSLICTYTVLCRSGLRQQSTTLFVVILKEFKVFYLLCIVPFALSVSSPFRILISIFIKILIIELARGSHNHGWASNKRKYSSIALNSRKPAQIYNDTH